MKIDTETVLNRTPPKILYHYTDQTGLMGILRERVIWATHTQYLNDDSEFRRALEIARAVINNRTGAGVDSDMAMVIWSEMYDATRGVENYNVCVTSFSEIQDSLSQWRAYSGSTSGFAIGFSGQSIRELVAKHECYFAPCIYDESDQFALIEAIVDEVFAENLKAKKRIEVDGDKDDELFTIQAGGNLIPRLHRYAPIVKDKKFAEEAEWRIITRPGMNRHFEFRSGKSTIVPYYKIQLDHENVSAKFVEIVVGPTPRRREAVAAVSKLLVNVGANDVKIVETEVPYRNW